jgi:hypothetical protein
MNFWHHVYTSPKHQRNFLFSRHSDVKTEHSPPYTAVDLFDTSLILPSFVAMTFFLIVASPLCV